MLLQILTASSCFVAGVFQLLATIPHLGERSILRVARRITAVSMLLAATYIAYAILYMDGVNPVYCLILGLFSLGQLLFSMNTFMEPHRTEELIKPASRKAKLGEATHA